MQVGNWIREHRGIYRLALFPIAEHPHLYDIGPSYLVIELVEGAALRGPDANEKAVEYAGQILEALDGAHRKGIKHRDLKPPSILVTKQGNTSQLPRKR